MNLEGWFLLEIYLRPDSAETPLICSPLLSYHPSQTVLFSQHDGARQEKAIVEAALASSVVHPHVVSVYHYDIKPVTSTATHGSLSALCIEDGEVPKDWRLYLVQVRTPEGEGRGCV